MTGLFVREFPVPWSSIEPQHFDKFPVLQMHRKGERRGDTRSEEIQYRGSTQLNDLHLSFGYDYITGTTRFPDNTEYPALFRIQQFTDEYEILDAVVFTQEQRARYGDPGFPKALGKSLDDCFPIECFPHHAVAEQLNKRNMNSMWFLNELVQLEDLTLDDATSFLVFPEVGLGSEELVSGYGMLSCEWDMYHSQMCGVQREHGTYEADLKGWTYKIIGGFKFYRATEPVISSETHKKDETPSNLRQGDKVWVPGSLGEKDHFGFAAIDRMYGAVCDAVVITPTGKKMPPRALFGGAGSEMCRILFSEFGGFTPFTQLGRTEHPLFYQ